MQKPWSELEVKGAVDAYLGLLKRQGKGEVPVKSHIYRELSLRFKGRSAKAFEYKFQNISAVLYEENLPYCDGLKPKFQYQNLLKLIVLDRVRRGEVQEREPYEILFGKLRELYRKGPISVIGRGSGRLGLSLENALGIPQNSSKQPDFMGIELKSKSDKTLQTLFSRIPSRYTGCKDKHDLLAQYGYDDTKRKRRALYTSFTNQPDSLGFFLKSTDTGIVVTNGGVEILEYDSEVIEEALLSKHSQTAYISLSKRIEKEKEVCYIEEMTYCRLPSIIKFLRLVEEGDIYLDFTLSLKDGKTKDHGFLWRIRTSALQKLYISTENMSVKL